MRRFARLAAALVVLATACAGGGGDERTILVDFSHDEFASTLLLNFPDTVKVRQGTTLIFRQTWTGEPHTVTGGKLADKSVTELRPWIEFFESYEGLLGAGVALPNPEDPGDATFDDFREAVNDTDTAPDLRRKFIASYDQLRSQQIPLPALDKASSRPFSEIVELVEKESDKAFGAGLPYALEEDVAQNAGQPCYLKEGAPPEDPDKACRDANQRQPIFDGSYSYYNSGIIPYEGQQGNTFRVALADDIPPAQYTFYCAVHGPFQSTTVDVVAADADAPSKDEISRSARRQIDEHAKPLEELYDDAGDGRITIRDPSGRDTSIQGPFAGLATPAAGHAGINAFVPKRLSVEAGEAITWKMMGAEHTISFDVPAYFPPVQFRDDGTIRFNPKLDPPAGGAPDIPEQEGQGILKVDGGTYDGEGFWSSGLLAAQPYAEYTLRIFEPGTYKYACLLHPPMVGTVEVT